MKAHNEAVVFVFIDENDQLIMRSYTPKEAQVFRRRIYEKRNETF